MLLAFYTDALYGLGVIIVSRIASVVIVKVMVDRKCERNHLFSNAPVNRGLSLQSSTVFSYFVGAELVWA